MTQGPTVRGEEEGEGQMQLQHLPDSSYNKATRNTSTVSRCWEQQMTVGLAVTGGRRFPLEGHTHMLPKAVILQDNKKGKKTTFPAGGGNLRGSGFFPTHQKPWPSQISNAQTTTPGTPQTTTTHFGVDKRLCF